MKAISTHLIMALSHASLGLNIAYHSHRDFTTVGDFRGAVRTHEKHKKKPKLKKLKRKK